METKVGGQIHGISLAAFLQMSEMEKTTCFVKVSSGDNVGYLSIVNGELVAAEAGELSKEDAAYEVISWEETVIEIVEDTKNRPREINQPLMSILMEGLRQKDEKAAMLKKSKQSDPAQKLQQEAKKKSEKTKEEKKAAKAREDSLSKDFESIKKKSEDKLKAAAVKEEKPAPKKAPKKQMIILSAVICSIVVIISAGLVSWVYVIQPKMLEKKYNEVLAEYNKLENPDEKAKILKNYIAAHPKTKQAKAAGKMLNELQELIEQQDYEVAIFETGKLPIDDKYKKSALSIYSKYLEKHPNGVHAKEIGDKITEIPILIDDTDFEALKAISEDDYDKRLEAYNGYLKEHPYGKYRDKVEKSITEMTVAYYIYLKKEIAECDKAKSWNRCINLSDTFVKTFTDKRRVDEVQKLKNEMQDKVDIAVLKDEIAEKEADMDTAKAMYLKYLKDHPDTSVKKMVLSELAKLEKKIQQKKEWEELSAYCMNKENSIFERVEKLTRFVNSKPSAEYAKEATPMLKHLEKEKKAVILEQKKEAERKRQEQIRLAEIKKEQERLQAETKKMQSRVNAIGGPYVDNGDGTVTDTRTGMMWCLLDSHVTRQKCLDHDSAVQFINGLNTGGYRDWKMPTSNELLVIYLNEPVFPSSGAKWYWTSESYNKGTHEVFKTVSEKTENVWEKSEADRKDCGSVRAVRK